MLRCALAGLAVLALFAQDSPHLSVDVALVSVAFTARDERGGLVRDLKQDDVEVFENNAPQKVSFFARSSDVPLTLGLLVDVSGSQDHFYKRHRKDMETFVNEALGKSDRAFLVCFGNHLRLVSEYTHSAPELFESYGRFHKGDRFPTLGPPDEVRILGTAFYDAIYYSIQKKMFHEDGRRALILFSDGEDNSSAYDMLDAIEAAQSENVLVYGIRYTEIEHGKLNARNKYGTRVMARIAKETGATDFDAGAGHMREDFEQIAEELRSSWELGYATSNPVRDGSFRNIAIRSKRPGITIRAKTGYFAR